mmetsp:Transcript_10466/g.34275  ORF Transcript_10466/g.34275 Transcript_10466/m.34275 type:complete len:299 (-) Transcript_10466:1980-2876(-)
MISERTSCIGVDSKEPVQCAIGWSTSQMRRGNASVGPTTRGGGVRLAVSLAAAASSRRETMTCGGFDQRCRRACSTRGIASLMRWHTSRHSLSVGKRTRITSRFFIDAASQSSRIEYAYRAGSSSRSCEPRRPRGVWARPPEPELGERRGSRGSPAVSRTEPLRCGICVRREPSTCPSPDSTSKRPRSSRGKGVRAAAAAKLTASEPSCFEASIRDRSSGLEPKPREWRAARAWSGLRRGVATTGEPPQRSLSEIGSFGMVGMERWATSFSHGLIGMPCAPSRERSSRCSSSGRPMML